MANEILDGLRDKLQTKVAPLYNLRCYLFAYSDPGRNSLIRINSQDPNSLYGGVITGLYYCPPSYDFNQCVFGHDGHLVGNFSYLAGAHGTQYLVKIDNNQCSFINLWWPQPPAASIQLALNTGPGDQGAGAGYGNVPNEVMGFLSGSKSLTCLRSLFYTLGSGNCIL